MDFDITVVAFTDTLDDVAAAAHRSTNRALALLQEWLSGEHPDSARLVVVTRRAVAVDDTEDVLDLGNAPVWGLVRSAQQEHPDRFVLVDIDVDTDEVTEQSVRAAVSTGEPQVAVRAGVVRVPRLVRTSAAPGAGLSGRVLVTGASGVLGGLVARHLVAHHGIRDLVLVSRGGADEDLVRELSASGAEVTSLRCDIGDRNAVEVLRGLGISGVVHAAGVLDDGVVTGLSPDRVDAVLRPKVDGAWHLHEIIDVESFVLFSAVSGALGGPGQGAYAAANVFLDALAQHRRANGMPAVSLGWGFWAERSAMTGRLDDINLTRLARFGVQQMSTADGLALFDAAINADRAAVLPMRLDISALRNLSATERLPVILRGLVPRSSRRVARQAGTTLADLPREQRGPAVLDLVRTQVAEVLGHASADAVDPDRALKDVGFDSLTAVELRNRLNAASGLRLRATLVFDFPTPSAIAAHLAGKLFPDNDSPEPADDEIRRVLAAIPAARLREAGLLDTLRRLAGAEAPTGTDSIDEMDLERLVNLALDSSD